MSDPVKPANPSVKLLKDYGWLIAVALIVAQQFGLLSVDQIAAIKKAIPVEQTEKITVDVKPLEPKPVEVASIKPEDFQQWADLIRRLIEEIKPKPEPKPIDPTPKPEPKPVDPKPLPVDPLPTPVDAKIVITDKNNTPITSPTIDANKWFRLSVAGVTGDYTVTVVSGTTPNPEIGPSTNGKEFSGVLRTGEWLHVVVSGAGIPVPLQQRVSANHSPMPPPHVVPDVKPVDPLPPVVGRVSLRVVYDAKAITPATAIVLNATSVWNDFTAAGSDWQFYDIKTTESLGVKAKSDAAGAAVPTLVIYDKVSGVKLEAVQLPKSVEELRSVVSKYTGK